MDPEIDFRALMARFDTILMGRKNVRSRAGNGRRRVDAGDEELRDLEHAAAGGPSQAHDRRRGSRRRNVPVLLGGGIPLLPPGVGRTKLRLSSSKAYKATGTMAVEYAVA